MSEAVKKNRKSRNLAIEKPKLDNARRLRGIYFIDPEDGAYKDIIRNARKKLERPMEAATPCKMGTKKRLKRLRETASETTESNKVQKTKHACIGEDHESSRKRFESTLPGDHEDRVAGKGFTSMTH